MAVLKQGTAPVFDIRHDETVRLIRERFYEDGTAIVRVGSIGKVIAMRNKEGAASYLIKFRGRGGPAAFDRDHIERA